MYIKYPYVHNYTQPADTMLQRVMCMNMNPVAQSQCQCRLEHFHVAYIVQINVIV